VTDILLLYHSRHGATAELANQISQAVESIPHCNAIIRCVAPVSSHIDSSVAVVPESGPPYATLDDMKNCDGLIMGSPAYFGNMAAELKYFLDQSTPLWVSGSMIGKPAAVFTSSSSLHGGQESVLLSMMLPLLHHGMVLCGIPYSESALHNTRSGATPYGASHVSSHQGTPSLTSDEISACHTLGKRVAEMAIKLSS
jgi:NAD(P)H dehydrogenase (quinone)